MVRVFGSGRAGSDELGCIALEGSLPSRELESRCSALVGDSVSVWCSWISSGFWVWPSKMLVPGSSIGVVGHGKNGRSSRHATYIRDITLS